MVNLPQAQKMIAADIPPGEVAERLQIPIGQLDKAMESQFFQNEVEKYRRELVERTSANLDSRLEELEITVKDKLIPLVKKTPRILKEIVEGGQPDKTRLEALKFAHEKLFGSGKGDQTNVIVIEESDSGAISKGLEIVAKKASKEVVVRLAKYAKENAVPVGEGNAPVVIED